MSRFTILYSLSTILFLAAAPAADYPAVTPGHAITFPHDEGSHPDFRIEWWYVTGWLEDDAGSPLGFQITFFRHRPGIADGNPSSFAPRQLLFAHAAVSDPGVGALLHDQRSAREGFGLATARIGSADVRLEDWSLEQRGDEYEVRVPAREFTLALTLRRAQPPLLQGELGYSRKGPAPTSASYYYSMPQLAVSGRIGRDGKERAVSGTAWFDHEWSSAIMDREAQGWDWLGINLDDGGALMAFRMRDRAGGQHWASATLRAGASARGAGTVVSFEPEEVAWEAVRQWRSPRTNIEYPVEWRVRVGESTYVVVPLMDDQESDSRRSTGTLYWEGAVELRDEAGRRLGRGYLELTGYGARLNL